MYNFENTPFFNNTFKYNNFQITLEQAKQYLKFFLNNEQYMNAYLYDLMNYEKLIYIEMTYFDDEDICYMIKKLKTIIADNWLKKQQLLNRIS